MAGGGGDKYIIVQWQGGWEWGGEKERQKQRERQNERKGEREGERKRGGKREIHRLTDTQIVTIWLQTEKIDLKC